MPEQLISKAMHHTMPESYVRSDAERPRLAADFPATDLYNPDRAAAVPQFGEPESYVRSDAERPRLAADFPATDLYNPDRAAVVRQIGEPESYVCSDAERPRLAADFPATDLYNPDRAAAVPQIGEPESYVRSDAERPRLAADFPATDLYNPDRAAVVPQNGDACSSHSFSQVLNHGVRCKRAAMAEAQEFFGLSPKEKAKLYSDNPAKKLRLSTSFNVRKETQINLTNQLQIIKNEDLQELTVLGSGASGTVHHGKWRGTDVAIKRFRTVISSELAQEFWREAEILSKLHHPNVVAFYGVVKDGPGGTLATLIEFMVNGSLRHVLQREGKFSDLRKRLLIAMDAAFGMEYLHSKNIVHFDLKCDNLLVNLRDHSRPICKVGDFGLSKIRSNTLVSGGVRGTLRWMAPERFNESKVSEKVDVFSFGIVMWELLTGEVPYANMEDAAVVGGIVTKKLRPTVPDNCEPEWRRLMEQCWSQDPAARPAFTEIASRLQSMAAAI